MPMQNLTKPIPLAALQRLIADLEADQRASQGMRIISGPTAHQGLVTHLLRDAREAWQQVIQLKTPLEHQSPAIARIVDSHTLGHLLSNSHSGSEPA